MLVLDKYNHTNRQTKHLQGPGSPRVQYTSKERVFKLSPRVSSALVLVFVTTSEKLLYYHKNSNSKCLVQNADGTGTRNKHGKDIQ